MVWIRVVDPHYGISTLSDDELLDKLQAMGQPGVRSTAPCAIRAAYEVAARRGLITPEEADSGVKEVLALRRAAITRATA